jgi:3-deoxy-D-manno-octulosonic-acid transferase
VMERLRGEPTGAGRESPLFILVPRQPHRFEPVASALVAAGFSVLRRSRCLDAALSPVEASLDDPQCDWERADVLVGDSLGEMFFYLELSQIVVVGGSFTPMGAHNVIEPMALAKPVLVGPVIWTIEFPAVEALEAGALIQVSDADGLVAGLRELFADSACLDEAARRAAVFYGQNAGATVRHMDVLREWMATDRQGGSEERAGSGSRNVRSVREKGRS